MNWSNHMYNERLNYVKRKRKRNPARTQLKEKVNNGLSYRHINFSTVDITAMYILDKG